MRYDPVGHTLVEVPGTEGGADECRRSASQLVELGHGVVLALVTEVGKTAAKYVNSESLVWRDAGVVLGYMSVAAEALELAFCPLGLTGHPAMLRGWPGSAQLRAAGLAVLGRRVDF